MQGESNAGGDDLRCCDLGRMQHTHSEEQLDRVLDALSSAAGPESFPLALELPDAVEELRRWMSDERQWRHAHAASWTSLLDDLRRTMANIPDAVLATAGDPSQLREELDLCRAEAANKEIRREALLQRRLGDLINRLASGLATAAAREAAWELLESSTDDESAMSAARLLLTLVRLSGHDREVTRKQLTYRLADSGVHRPLAPSWHRLQRAAQLATIEPAVGVSVVWLQLSLATVEDPAVIDLGASVRVSAPAG